MARSGEMTTIVKMVVQIKIYVKLITNLIAGRVKQSFTARQASTGSVVMTRNVSVSKPATLE